MINLALIGLGQWGKNYLSTIKAFPDCRIKYICSQTLKGFSNYDNGYIKTTNFKELFKYRDIDGVIIATPGLTHFRIAEEFLKNGFNLLIEKPLAMDYKSALSLKTLNNKVAAKVLVGHIYLFDPAFVQMKKLFKQVGSLKSLSYTAENHGPFRSDMSVLWDFGPHPVALFLDLLQKNPRSISARGNSDVIHMKIKFSDNITAFVNLSRTSLVKRRELTVVGTKSTFIYNDLEKNRLAFYEGIGLERMQKIKYPSYNHRLPLELELEEFINAISGNQDIKRSGLDFGVKVTKLLSLAEQSIKRGGEVIDAR